MIRSFRCAETEKIFNRQFSRRLPQGIQRTAYKKLLMLHRSQTLSDLRMPPQNRLEALSADRKGQQSIRINEQWRICFVWKGGDAFEVEIIDYH